MATSGPMGWWQLNNKIVSPGNSTYDLAIGGTATGSAFQVFGSPTSAGDIAKINSSVITSGNLVEATSSAITTGSFIKLGEGGDQSFSGNGLLLDFDNTGGGGGAFTGNFETFKNAGSTKYSVDSSGNVTTAGNVAVNGGSLTTTQTTANLFNSTATTLNIGGAATTLNLQGAGSAIFNIGNSTGTTALNLTSGTGSQTFTSSNATGALTSGAFVFNDTSLSSGDLIYATASAITSGNLLKLGQGGNSAFSGNAILADLDSTGGGGGTFTGNFALFKNAGTTDLTIDASGNMSGLGALQIGSGSHTVAYSRLGTTATSNGLSASQDLLIGGKLEVNGTLFLNSSNIANSHGISTIAFCITASCSSQTT